MQGRNPSPRTLKILKLQAYRTQINLYCYSIIGKVIIQRTKLEQEAAGIHHHPSVKTATIPPQLTVIGFYGKTSLRVNRRRLVKDDPVKVNWKRCSDSVRFFDSKTKAIYSVSKVHLISLMDKRSIMPSLLYTLQTKKSSAATRAFTVAKLEEIGHHGPHLVGWLNTALSIHQVADY